MSDPDPPAAPGSLEGLLANLRRQATMSPMSSGNPQGPQATMSSTSPGNPQGSQGQQQFPQQYSQQQPLPQQPPNPLTQMYGQPPPMDGPPYHAFSRPQYDSPVYSPMHPPPQPGYQPGPNGPEMPFPSMGGMPFPPAVQQLHPQVPEPTMKQPFSGLSTPPTYQGSMSPAASNLGENRTNSLLSLLKFSQAVPALGSPGQENAPPTVTTPSTSTPPRPSVNSPAPPQQPLPHNRSIAPSDLVATLFPNAAGKEITGSSSASASPVQQRNTAQPSPGIQRASTAESVPQKKDSLYAQDLVFQLLGRTKPDQNEQPRISEGSSTAEQTTGPASQRDSPRISISALPPPPQYHTTGPSENSEQATQIEPPMPPQTPSKGLFSYVNPFDQLSASSPRNRGKPGTPGPGAVPKRSQLGLNEFRAENIPLPSSNPVSPAPLAPAIAQPPVAAPAPVEAEAAKDVATIGQVKEKEQFLMEQLGEYADAYVPQPQQEDAPIEFENHLEEAMEVPEVDVAESEFAEVEEYDTYESPGPKEDKKHQDQPDEDGYESAPETQPVAVYNFPMKPFISITIVPSAIRRIKYPSSKMSDIARMARTFDQLDRNLIAATLTHIAYAIAKSDGSGGIRVVRQYDGKDRIIMKGTADRTFNVTIGRGERVIGTGVSGAVLWVDLNEDFERDDWPSMFVFPPSEEQGQSNGVLKSRARKTSRQEDTFAIGRGKTISIIHAPTARAYAEGREGNVVDSKKYLANHARTIDTGKASKDFAFSDDDSVIISIDKAGKLKLWDVQELLKFEDNDNKLRQPMALSTPTLYFSAVAAGESYRATSVMFLDKYRPYMKCMALRYVIVGMKQNHTLQLWDLALGRAVQEINFPQESDTDALCSVAYHPSSGIIVVGNPTKNSIYFIHLSAPKYNLPPLSQAQYIKGLANKDPSIPKPEATAILSGLREYSFASKGQLMSLDIYDCEVDPQEENPVQFELYVAHSKGMTTLSVFKEDLGWDMENRVANPVDAIAKGACTYTNMPPPPPPERERERDDKSETPIDTATQNPKPNMGNTLASTETADRAASELNGTNGAANKKKKISKTGPTAAGAAEESKTEKNTNAVAIAKPKSVSIAAPTSQGDASEINIPAGFLDVSVKRIEESVSTEFNKVLRKELDQMYRKFDDANRQQLTSGDKRQHDLLRVLSDTLTCNVENVMERIVSTNIKDKVVPAISHVTMDTVQRTLGDSLNRSLNSIPDTFAQPEFTSRVVQSLAQPVSQILEREFQRSLSVIMPSFHKAAVDTAQRAVIEMERKHNAEIAQLQEMHRADSRKIDQLMSAVSSLAETVNQMSISQAEFQKEARAAQAEYYEQAAVSEKTPEMLEAEEIEEMLQDGRYEDGTIKWLQSKDRQAELFDEVMVRYRYDFLPNLTQLVLLSVSAAVSVKFENKILERLSWLEGVLAVLDPMDPEISGICNRIMTVVVQRLEAFYMTVSGAGAGNDSQNPILRKIPSIARRARELSNLCNPQPQPQQQIPQHGHQSQHAQQPQHSQHSGHSPQHSQHSGHSQHSQHPQHGQHGQHGQYPQHHQHSHHPSLSQYSQHPSH